MFTIAIAKHENYLFIYFFNLPIYLITSGISKVKINILHKIFKDHFINKNNNKSLMALNIGDNKILMGSMKGYKE